MSKKHTTKLDDVALTEFEKRVFRRIIFGSFLGAVICGLTGVALASANWMTGAAVLVLIGLIFALFWFFQESMVSFRDYGLGEGVANLYGEERAKMMFGEDYKRREKGND